MLREGLAAEFPFAKRAISGLVSSARSAEVSREAPMWAAVSAVGASWAVHAVGSVLATGIRFTGLHDPASWVSGAFTILGYAIALGVALRAGRRTGVAWYLAILAVSLGIQAAMTVPGRADFCARSVELCQTPLQFALPYAYVAVGLAAGALAVRVVRAGQAGSNVLLNGAGAYGLLATPIVVVFFLIRPQDVSQRARWTLR